MSAAPRAESCRHIDAANVDLKGFTGDFYHRVCLAKLDPVLQTLAYLTQQTSVWVEITTLLIPGLNDSDAEISALTRWVARQLGPDVPVHFTAFHPDYKMRDRPPTPPATLTRARRIALDTGIRYAYTGNTHDTTGQSRYCHHCGELVIERDWYRLGAYRLTPHGRCLTCDLTFITGSGFARVRSCGLEVCGLRPVDLRTNRPRNLAGRRTLAR